MNKRVPQGVETPLPNDLRGWRDAIEGNRLQAFRIEAAVEAVQTLGTLSDSQVVNGLMAHISDEMLRWLRRFIGRHHRNQGVDLIENVHGEMIEAVLRPNTSDGVGLRTAFYKRLRFRATDALQEEKEARARHEFTDDPNVMVPDDDGGQAALIQQQNVEITQLLECVRDPRKRRAFILHMEGCPLAPGRATVSVAGELGVSAKTAGEWIDEVIALLKSKIGEQNE